MKLNKKSAIYGMVLAAAFSCQKTESEESAESDPGADGGALPPATAAVSQSESETVTLSGQLAIDLNLVAADVNILAFEMMGSEPAGKPAELELAEDNSFSHPVGKSLEVLEFLNKVIDEKDPSDDDIDRLAEIFDASASDISDYLDEAPDEIYEYVQEFIDQYELLGGSSTLLIAYEKSGDKIKEAKSFKFIGMAAGDDNLSLIPNGSLKGSVSMGSIPIGEKDDAKSELNATDALDLEEGSILELAKADDLLKAIRNDHMNENWDAEPFYMWIDSISNVTDLESYSTPGDAAYSGVGFYVGSRKKTPFVYEDICAENASSRKAVEFIPPAAITTKASYESEETVSITKISNKGEYFSRSSQGDNRICNSDGFYAREDGINDFMLNFGTGGGVVGSLPTGIWTLKYDGDAIGWFDIASSSPFDADDNLRVFLPSIKLTISSGKITGGTIKVYKEVDGDLATVTDFNSVKKITSNWGASVTKNSNSEEVRTRAEFDDDDGVLNFTFDESVSVSDAGPVAISYEIGSSNYRVEYRTEGQ